MFKPRQEPHEPLPVTAEELEQFMTNIITKYSLPDTDESKDIICQLIMHMNPAVAAAPLSYFANSVNQARAKAVAYPKLEEFAAKRKKAREDAIASAQASQDATGTTPGVTVLEAIDGGKD